MSSRSNLVRSIVMIDRPRRGKRTYNRYLPVPRGPDAGAGGGRGAGRLLAGRGGEAGRRHGQDAVRFAGQESGRSAGGGRGADQLLGGGEEDPAAAGRPARASCRTGWCGRGRCGSWRRACASSWVSGGGGGGTSSSGSGSAGHSASSARGVASSIPSVANGVRFRSHRQLPRASPRPCASFDAASCRKKTWRVGGAPPEPAHPAGGDRGRPVRVRGRG